MNEEMTVDEFRGLRAAAAVFGIAAAAVAIPAGPAHASTTVTVTTAAQLATAMNYQGAGTETVVLGSSMALTPTTGAGLTTSVASNIILDLNSQRLSITTADGSPGVVIGSGSTLTVTDTGSGGTLIATAAGPDDTVSRSTTTSIGGAGIQTSNAQLVIAGDATVNATGYYANYYVVNGPRFDGAGAGIGSSDSLNPSNNSGAVTIQDTATVTALSPVGGAGGAGIGGYGDGCRQTPGNGATVIIQGTPSITTSGYIASSDVNPRASIGGGTSSGCAGPDGAPGTLSEPVPAITSLSPQAVGSDSGGQVTINGTGFLGSQFVSAVLLNGAALPASAYSVQDGRSITVSLPTHAPGNVPLVVKTAGGSSNSVVVSYPVPPQLPTRIAASGAHPFHTAGRATSYKIRVYVKTNGAPTGRVYFTWTGVDSGHGSVPARSATGVVYGIPINPRRYGTLRIRFTYAGGVGYSAAANSGSYIFAPTLTR